MVQPVNTLGVKNSDPNGIKDRFPLPLISSEPSQRIVEVKADYSLVAGFEVGRRMNQLGWYLEQATLLNSKSHGESVKQVLTDLRPKVLEMAPSPYSGDRLRAAVDDTLQELRLAFRSEWFAEDYAIARDSLEEISSRSSRPADLVVPKSEIDEAFDTAYRGSVPRLRLWDAIKTEVREVFGLMAAVLLGEVVDQICRPPDVASYLFELQRNPRRRACLDKYPESKKRITGWDFTGGNSAVKLPLPYWPVGCPREPGVLSPPDKVVEEIEVLWRRLQLPLGLPKTIELLADTSSPLRRRMLAEQVAMAAQNGLTRLADSKRGRRAQLLAKESVAEETPKDVAKSIGLNAEPRTRAPADKPVTTLPISATQAASGTPVPLDPATVGLHSSLLPRELPWIDRTDPNRSLLVIGDQSEVIPDDDAVFLDTLFKEDGRWVASKIIAERLGGGEIRPSRIVKRLPRSVKNFILRKAGAGSRFDVASWLSSAKNGP